MKKNYILMIFLCDYSSFFFNFLFKSNDKCSEMLSTFKSPFVICWNTATIKKIRKHDYSTL